MGEFNDMPEDATPRTGIKIKEKLTPEKVSKEAPFIGSPLNMAKYNIRSAIAEVESGNKERGIRFLQDAITYLEELESKPKS